MPVDFFAQISADLFGPFSLPSERFEHLLVFLKRCDSQPVL